MYVLKSYCDTGRSRFPGNEADMAGKSSRVESAHDYTLSRKAGYRVPVESLPKCDFGAGCSHVRDSMRLSEHKYGRAVKPNFVAV